MNVLRRHPFAVLLLALVCASALAPLPPLVDAVTGAVPGDADLSRPVLYVLFAPVSNVLDALAFLTVERAEALLLTWAAALAAWGLLARGDWRRRALRAALAPVAVLALAGAAVVLPRPVPSLVEGDSAATVIDYHAHTESSHDGRKGWTYDDLARWHAAQGFQASYVTDHNVPSVTHDGGAIPLLPGVEWSVYRQHIVALGPVRPIARDSFSRDTPSMLGVFAALHKQGAIAIASIPEYWENHREDLDQFIAAGVDGFEIVNCAPKALRFSSADRRDVLDLARTHDLLVTGASDNHGWGKVTCVWNVSEPGGHGFRANQVLARSLALAQGDLAPGGAGFDQPWLMLRTLSWSERASWITWLAVYLIYMGVPRRSGQTAGLGILARTLRRGPA
ncbi:MAG TPA: hypothetical protein VI160_09830 [Gemmatimonadales bacterium]